jgi:hypothetical protein
VELDSCPPIFSKLSPWVFHAASRAPGGFLFFPDVGTQKSATWCGQALAFGALIGEPRSLGPGWYTIFSRRRVRLRRGSIGLPQHDLRHPFAWSKHDRDVASVDKFEGQDPFVAQRGAPCSVAFGG